MLGVKLWQIALLIFLFPAIVSAQHINAWRDSTVARHMNAFADETEEYKDVTLYFTADWCPYCQIVKRDIISKLPKGSVKIIDVDLEERLWEKYSLITGKTNLPLAVYVGKDGKWKRWIMGAGKSGGPGDYKLDEKGFNWLRTGIREEEKKLSYKIEDVNVDARDKRILVFTQPNQNWIQPSAHEKLLKSGWKIGISPKNHVQIIYDEDIAKRYGLTSQARYATIDHGEIVRQFEVGCGMALDQWAVGWLFDGNQKTAEKIARSHISKENKNYPLRGNWWTVDGQSRPTKQYIIDHLRMSPSHAGKVFQNWDLDKFSYEELQSLHSDDHENRIKQLIKRPVIKKQDSRTIARPKSRKTFRFT